MNETTTKEVQDALDALRTATAKVIAEATIYDAARRALSDAFKVRDDASAAHDAAFAEHKAAGEALQAALATSLKASA